VWKEYKIQLFLNQYARGFRCFRHWLLLLLLKEVSEDDYHAECPEKQITHPVCINYSLIKIITEETSGKKHYDYLVVEWDGKF
jgi:hypothetical protein